MFSDVRYAGLVRSSDIDELSGRATNAEAEAEQVNK